MPGLPSHPAAEKVDMDHGDIGAAGVQVLRDIVAAVAGAHHQRLAALPGMAGGVLAGMQHRAREIVETRRLRTDRNGADAGGEDQMPRPEDAQRAILAPQRDFPASLGLIEHAVDHFGAWPDVEVHRVAEAVPGGRQ